MIRSITSACAPSGRSIGLMLLLVCWPAGHADETAAAKALARIQQSVQSGDLVNARRELGDLQEQDPADPRVYNLLGVIDAQESNLAAAEANFRRALQIAPRFTGAYLNLGRLYQEQGAEPGQLAKALDVYDRILGFEPGNVEANYQAAALLHRLRRFNLS